MTNKNQISTRDMLNEMVRGFVSVQERVNEVAKSIGRPLTKEEELSLTSCSRCGDLGDCTCGE